MAARMQEIKNNPGIYKRVSRYVVVWRHKGRQHKSFHVTLGEAREAKGERQGGDRRPVTRQSFEDHTLGWLDSYSGRTSRGLSNRTREAYRSTMLDRAVPFFRRHSLADVGAPTCGASSPSSRRTGSRPRPSVTRWRRCEPCSPRRSRMAPYGRIPQSAFASTDGVTTTRRERAGCLVLYGKPADRPPWSRRPSCRLTPDSLG